MNNPKGLLVILQGFSFFFYLYFSFSSYIDLFIGVARIFNVELSNNFGNRVYAATSRKNFWAEWHITLNHWFRDYFFFPLAKKIKTRSAFNVAILSTFILIGFWHGISIRYALWGLINGVWILLEQKLTPLFKSFPVRFRKYGGLFYHLLLASMVAILFSANNPLSMYRNLLMPTSIDEVVVKSLIKNCVFLCVLIFLFDKLSRNMGSSTFDLHVAKLPMTTRWLLYMLLTSAILIFTFTGRIQNYYFKF